MNDHLKSPVALAIAAILSSAQALAADPSDSRETIVVVGSRVPVGESQPAIGTTVLEREEFMQDKPTSVADVLRKVSGLHVDSVGGRGGTGSVYLRGADPNYTLVLIDGVRVNDPTNARGGSFDFSLLDIADVERIEVARGPYSALYGTDALAGVVNIVTRGARREKTTMGLTAMAGSDDVRELSARFAGPAGDGDWNLTLSDAREGEVVAGNDFQSQTASGGFKTEFADGYSLALNGRYTNSEREGFPDDSGGSSFAAIRDVEKRDAHETVFGATLAREVQEGGYSLSVSQFDRQEDILSPGVAPGLRDPFGIPPSVVDSDLSRLASTLSLYGRADHGISYAVGADYQRETGRTDGVLDFGGGFMLPTSFDLTRKLWATFAEFRLDTEHAMSYQVGVRVDKADGYGSVTSPRASVAWRTPGSSYVLSASWGKAFKLPSLYALGHPIVGNPELAPERSESYEVAFGYEPVQGRGKWSVTYFDNTFRNAIDFDPGPPPMLVNRNRIDAKGYELSGELRVGESWWFGGNVTHTENEIAGSDAQLRSRPEWRGNATVRYAPTESLQFSLSGTHVGSVFDSSIPTGDVRLGAYTRVDATASWNMTEKFELFVTASNLTDEEYQEFVGFEARGSSVMAGFDFKL
jgi:vitamin B12 transporter